MKYNRAVMYARYSSDSQQEQSITGQVRDGRAFCVRNKLNLIGIYKDEAISGGTDKRPDFQRLIEDSAKDLFDFVIIWKIDRLARNAFDFLKYQKILAANGVRILSCTDSKLGENDDPETNFFNLIQIGLAEMHLGTNKRLCKRGARESALALKHVGGLPALGFDVDKKTKKYVINPKEAEAVKILFDMFANQGKTYNEIAKFLNDNGYEYRGKPFYPKFHELLRNVKYNAVYIYNRCKEKKLCGKRTNRENKPEDEIIRIPGGMPRIVDEATFIKAQELLDARKYNQPDKARYLLTSKIFCATCGYAMCSGNKFGGRDKKHHYVYYSCMSRRMKNTQCRTKDLPDDKMVDFVKTEIRARLTKDHETVTAVINKQINKLNQRKEPQKDFTEEIEKINMSIENFIKALATADPNGGAYAVITQEIEKLTAQRQEFQQEENITAFEQPIPHITSNTVMNGLVYYLDLMEKDTFDSWREIIRDFVKDIQCNNEKLVLRLRLNPLIWNYTKEEILVETTRDRDSIVLASLKKRRQPPRKKRKYTRRTNP